MKDQLNAEVIDLVENQRLMKQGVKVELLELSL